MKFVNYNSILMMYNIMISSKYQVLLYKFKLDKTINNTIFKINDIYMFKQTPKDYKL